MSFEMKNKELSKEIPFAPRNISLQRFALNNFLQ